MPHGQAQDPLQYAPAPHAHVAAPPQGMHMPPPQYGDTSKTFAASESAKAATIKDRPCVKVALLPGETQLCETMQSTLTCPGQPYYKVMFTDRRLVIVIKKYMLFCIKDEYETSIMYRDIVDVHVSSSRSRIILFIGLFLLVAGLLGCIVYAIGDHPAGAIAFLLFFALPGLAMMVSYIVKELLAPGDDLLIDVCKVGTSVNTWNPWGTARHANKTMLARLSKQDAYSAMYMLLDNPLVPLVHRKGGREGKEKV